MSETVQEAFGRKWKRVWQEDECTRHTEGHTHASDVWFKRYGTKMPKNSEADEKIDYGDAMGFRFGDRMYEFSFDGGSLWEAI